MVFDPSLAPRSVSVGGELSNDDSFLEKMLLAAQGLQTMAQGVQNVGVAKNYFANAQETQDTLNSLNEAALSQSQETGLSPETVKYLMKSGKWNVDSGASLLKQKASDALTSLFFRGGKDPNPVQETFNLPGITPQQAEVPNADSYANPDTYNAGEMVKTEKTKEETLKKNPIVVTKPQEQLPEASTAIERLLQLVQREIDKDPSAINTYGPALREVITPDVLLAMDEEKRKSIESQAKGVTQKAFSPSESEKASKIFNDIPGFQDLPAAVRAQLVNDYGGFLKNKGPTIANQFLQDLSANPYQFAVNAGYIREGAPDQ